MKVIFCISDLRKGGAEKVLTDLCVHGKRMDPRFEPLVIAVRGGFFEKRLRKAGVETTVVAPSGAGLSGLIVSIGEAFGKIRRDRKSIQAVHGFLPLGGLVAWCASLLCGAPFIYAIRSSNRYFDLMRDPVRFFMHRLALAAADLVTCNTPCVKRQMGGRPVEVVLNGIEPPSMECCVDELVRRDFFAEPDRFHVVWVSSMRYPPKDVYTLLETARLLPEMRFVMVGDGKGLPDFKRRAGELGLNNVAWAGFRKNVYPFIHYGDLYVLLTEHEGFPNTVLEAMSVGKPIVVSDIDEIKEALPEVEGVSRVENARPGKLADLLESERRAGARKGSEFLRSLTESGGTFSHETMVKRFLRLYRRAREKPEGRFRRHRR